MHLGNGLLIMPIPLCRSTYCVSYGFISSCNAGLRLKSPRTAAASPSSPPVLKISFSVSAKLIYRAYDCIDATESKTGASARAKISPSISSILIGCIFSPGSLTACGISIGKSLNDAAPAFVRLLHFPQLPRKPRKISVRFAKFSLCGNSFL